MAPPSAHHIPETNSAYRRGMVLGLTMAEVGILIIFVLLLLIGVDQLRREADAKAMDGSAIVPVERLQSLAQAESLVAELRESLQLPVDTTPDEIRRLVRALQRQAATSEGQTMLAEWRASTQEMRTIRDEIKQSGAPDKLVERAEEQSFRISNQEGQLRRYETQLREAGLGKGERPCWVRPDGTIDFLYEVVLTSTGIRMRELSHEDRARERSLLPMPVVSPSQTLSPNEFLRLTEPLYKSSLAQNCRFFVVIYDATGPAEKELYKSLLRTVEGHFYKRLDRGPAPF